MSVQIQVRPDGDATVVTLRGVADGAVLQRLGDTISAASPDGELLLLDLSDLLVADPSDLGALVDELTRHRAREQIRIVAREQSTIALFNEAGITSLVSVHRDIGNAIDTHHLVGGRRRSDRLTT
jgi:anti-anti-sigma regulatory factor